MDELDELTQTLLNIYNKNLDFLQSNHQEVFEKVNTLSNKIEIGKYKERYSLEYKESYFDIYDNQKEEYIYDFNSYKEADKRRELTNSTQDNSFNLLRINSITKELALLGTKDKMPLIDYINEKIDFNNISFSKIYKFIFIGVGLGIHIHEIYKKMDSMTTLIIEPNLEIFRLSLFMIDYSIFQVNNKTLFLSVDENRLEMYKTIEDFSTMHNYMNYNIKRHLFHPEYKYILDDIIDYYATNHPYSFPYDSLLKVFSRTIKFMKNDFRFLQKELIEEKLPLQNKKILLISAGPSLDAQIDWIKENQNKFIIICVDVILGKLEENSIIPNIVVSIDPSNLCSKYLTTKDKDYLKNSALIFLSQQHEETINTVKDLNFFFSQVLPISKKLNYSFSLSNVGTFSFALAVFLGANELYLTGCDAAFNQTTGERYAKGSSHTQTEELAMEKDDTGISGDDILEVKGNLREKIKTNRKLLVFKDSYEGLIHTLTNDFTAYNLSDGVYIEGLKPLKISDLDLSFKDEEFNTVSEIKATTCIVDDIEVGDDIEILNRIILKVNKVKRLKLKTRDQFLQERLDYIIWIMEQKKELNNAILATIFMKFMELIDIYINFALNQKQENLYTKDFLNRLNLYWCNALLTLLKQMKEAIKE